MQHSTARVCTDCYFAHHYGAREVDGRWFTDDSDSPADREPLNLLEGYDLADDTNSETGDGLEDFSWSSCDGCGSTLGGARYRLAAFELAAPLDAPEQDTPDEYDDYIGDATHGYSVMRGGRHLGTFSTERRAAAALYLERERSCYWPNVWRINERGNTTLCVFDSHLLRATDTSYV